MDEEIERLVVRVRADTAGFARDVDEMRGSLEGPLGDGVRRAGDAIERGLLRAVRTGKLGFEELKQVALSVLAEIAAGAVRGGLDEILGRGGRGGGGGQGGGGLIGVLGGIVGALPGRATGGPVSPGAAYMVGERGPEMFVPAASGRIVAPQVAGSMGAVLSPPAVAAGAAIAPPPPREVRVAITVNAQAGEAPAALQRSSRQVARAVRAALEDLD